MSIIFYEFVNGKREKSFQYAELIEDIFFLVDGIFLSILTMTKNVLVDIVKLGGSLGSEHIYIFIDYNL